MVEINGVVWTLYVLPYVLGRKLKKDLRVPLLDRRIKKREQKQSLPGIHSTELQLLIWESWDWKVQEGEEWTQSKAWKESVEQSLICPRLHRGSDILEIGPGAGRWTETLARIAGSLTLVDISEQCIEMCREKFGHLEHVSYHVTAGSDLSFIPNQSIDAVWSFDVFVHLAPQDIDGYLRELVRVLRPGGTALIHHADEGGLYGGWRSSMTANSFMRMAGNHGLVVIEQFDSWGESGEFDVRYYHDIVSAIRKPD